MASDHGELVKILLINTQAADAGEDEFVKKVGVSSACVRVQTTAEQMDSYGVVKIPHVTVIHRDGMVVRNGFTAESGHSYDEISALVKQMVSQP
mmetsp:Transcript_71973/g.161573  ORF Transcript_71973/g.161573 Transcript_71973/m.161573 type:complete len:94 (+) Transcript_71973:3-284(+)